MKIARYLVGLVLAATSFATLGAPNDCPNDLKVKGKIDERAVELEKVGASIQGLGATQGISSADLLISISDLLVHRAKAEAVLWATRKMQSGLCSKQSAYFPNTCGHIAVHSTAIDSSVLVKKLRTDIYAVPGCAIYQQVKSRGPETTSLDAFDGYALEAVLIAYYASLAQVRDFDPGSSAPQLTDPGQTWTADRLQLAILGFLTNYMQFLCRGQPTTGACENASGFFLSELHTTLVGLSAGAYSTPAKYKIASELDRIAVKAALFNTSPSVVSALSQLATFASALNAALDEDYRSAAAAVAGLLGCSDAGGRKACRYVAVASELASVKDREDFERIANTIFDPVGGWARKDAEPVASITAMLGVGGGYERLKGDDASTSTTSSGLFAPIGIEYSVPTDAGFISRAALGFSFVDVGGILTYSKEDGIGTSAVKAEANSSFSAIAAPGVYGAIGFHDSPFRLGVSYMYAPALRQSEDELGNSRDLRATRIIGFLAFDLTLLGF